jgi:hypothetical protein
LEFAASGFVGQSSVWDPNARNAVLGHFDDNLGSKFLSHNGSFIIDAGCDSVNFTRYHISDLRLFIIAGKGDGVDSERAV